jgi:hypothetical protein
LSSSDSRQVDRDDGVGPSLHGASQEILWGLPGWDADTRHHRLTHAQVEAERDTATTDSVANLPQRAKRRQGFQPDHHALGAEAERSACGRKGRRARIQPQRYTERDKLTNERLLCRATENRVKIGDVQLLQAKTLHVRSRHGGDAARFDE